MVAQPSYKTSDTFERSINTLEQYYILKTLLYGPLFDSLVKIPQPTRKIIGGGARIRQITQRNQSVENQRLVQRFTNVNLGLQAQETYDQGSKTQIIVTSIETKEDNLRKKLDEGLQNLENIFYDFSNKIIEFFSELALEDFATKFHELHRIIKRFDGDYETDYFPKFNKIYDTVLALKTDAILKPKIININKKINSLSDAAQTLKEKLDHQENKNY